MSTLQDKLLSIEPQPTPINTWSEFHCLEIQINNGRREREITGREHTDYEVADIWKKNEWISRHKNTEGWHKTKLI